MGIGKNIITGIDAGTSTIKIVIAERRKDGGGLNVLGASKTTSKGIRRGYVTNFEETAESIEAVIEKAERMADLPIKKAYVSAGGISLGSIKSKGMIMISRPDGKITDYDVKRVVTQSENNLPDIANKQIIHKFPLGFKVDGTVVMGKPAGMQGTKLEVETLFITCLNQHLLELIKAIETAGVVVEDVIASPLAASFVTLTNYQKEAGCVLANIGAGTVSIIIFEEGIPVSLEVFPIGSTHITNDIALGLQIPLEEAEQLKLEFGPNTLGSKRKLSDIIEARLNDIFELIESHLKKINRSGLLPAGIILTGGGSGLISLEDVAKASLRLPAKVGTILPSQHKAKITLSGNIKTDILKDPEWSVALGLCLKALSEELKEDMGGSRFIHKTGSTLRRLMSSFLP